MRKHRYYSVSGNFRSGVLSPAAQDDITREDWLNGAAEITNFDILRDGGIRTRPRLIRMAAPVPRLTRRVLGEVTPPPVGTGFRFSNDPSVSGAMPLPVDGSAILSFTVPSQSNRLRFFELRGVRLRRGPWRVGVGDDAELVFGWEARRVGRSGQFFPLDRRTLSEGDKGDPYHRYAFAPGLVRRDIVVQVPRDDPSKEYVYIDELRLVVQARKPGSQAELALPGNLLELEIESVHAYDAAMGGQDLGPPQTTFPLDAETDRDRVRLIPWELRGFDLALVLGRQQLMVVGAQRSKRPWVPELVVPLDNAWAFTERQLRELTYCTYGSHLLLFHDEFPRPLEVRLSGTGQLSMEFLGMENVPQLPARLAPEARLDVRTDDAGRITLDQPEPSAGAPRRAVVPTNIVARAAVGEVALRWDDVGATRYQVYVQTEAAYAALDPNTAWVGVVPTVVTEPRATVSGLLGGTEYRFALASVVDAGPNAIAGNTDPLDADDTKATPLRGALAAPVLAAVLSDTVDGSVLLTWASVANAERYRVEVRVGQGVWVRAAQQPAPGALRLAFAGTPGVQYSFRLVAESDVAPESVPSNVVVVTARRNAPGAPTGLAFALDENVNGRVSLSWSPGENADSYDVQVDDDGAFGSPLVDLGGYAARSLVRTYTQDNGVYPELNARVRSNRITGGGVLESAWEEVKFTPAWVPLQQVTGVRFASVGGVRGLYWDWPTYGNGFLRGNPSWQWRFGPGADPSNAINWFGANVLPAGSAAFVSLAAMRAVAPGGGLRWVQVRARHRDARPVVEGAWSVPVQIEVPS